MWSQPISIQLRKISRENLAGKSCGTGRREKSQFKKGCDWWKFSIWNRVIGSQPIRIQLGKILWENLAGKSCGKILWEILSGKSCGKFLRENLAGNFCAKILREIPVRKSCGENLAGKSCRKFLRESLVGQRGGKKANLRKAVIGGNLAFGIG